MSIGLLSRFGMTKVSGGGASVFPTLIDTATGQVDSSTNPFTVPLPATYSSGDLLIAFIRSNAGTLATPSGWTKIANPLTAQHAAYYRVSDGSEGSSVSISPGTFTRGAYITASIGDYSGVPEAADVDLSGDPPLLTPSWGSQKTLWIAFTSAKRSDSPYTAAPTNYTDLTTAANPSNTSTLRVQCAIAFRELEASSEDPGDFTGAVRSTAVASTLAVLGA